MEKLELHKEYNFDKIELFAKENELYEKVNGFLELFSDGDTNGEIGEIVLPLYFESGSVAANFILTGYGTQSWWRCIYVSQTLSINRKHEV